MQLWSPPVGLSAQEARFLARLRNGKLYAFLREVRHEVFDEATQQALMATYTARGSGKTPVPPALLAMVLVLQGALHVSDEEAVERATSDRRWQLVLGTFDDNEEAPFTKSTLYAFRERLIQHNLDVMLFDRVVAWARASKGYSHTALRAAFDSAPLRGAGRVEDTFNLLGHAVREVLRTVSDRTGRSIEDVAHAAGIPLVVGSSLKASLDRDWDDPAQRKQALTVLLAQIDSLGKWLRAECELTLAQPPLADQWKTVERLIAQDTEPDPEGGGQGGRRIKRGVAAERQISITDPAMRHGRKSKSTRVDGYKRHLGTDLDTKLTVAVSLTRANRPEGEGAEGLVGDVTRQGFSLQSAHVDRAYLEAPAFVAARSSGMALYCKAFTLRNRGQFTKADFTLDVAGGRIVCPAGEEQPLVIGRTAHFPASTCQGCALRMQCTRGKGGRSVTIHDDEPFLIELRARQKTPEGRAELRRRTAVEHRLAHLVQHQGHQARYRGERKNLFDLRRHAIVENLFVAMADAA
jgi:hypothetical protein